jgi:hypothetical protein
MLLLSDSVVAGADETTASTEGIERRRGLRIRQNRPVKIFDAAAARYFGGQTQNVSATGLRVQLPAYAPLEPGDELSIHVGLNELGQQLANRRQMIPSRVVWVNRQDAPVHGKIEAGVEFLSGIAAHLDAA